MGVAGVFEFEQLKALFLQNENPGTGAADGLLPGFNSLPSLTLTPPPWLNDSIFP